jgi:TolB-like protein
MSASAPPPRPGDAGTPARVSHATYARRSLVWLLLPLAAGAVLLVRHLGAGRAAASDTVAVLPFAAGGADAGAAVLADGMTDGLAEALGSVPGVLVIGAAGGDAAALPAEPREAGRVLGARLVVTGRAERQGDTLAVSADLVDVATGGRRGGAGIVRPVAALLDVEEDLAVDIVRALRPAAAARVREALRRRRAPGEAVRQLLMRARFLTRTGGEAARAEAAACLAQATHDAPAYAAAHAALATLNLRAAAGAAAGDAERAALVNARAAVSRALALDPDLAEAVAARGRVEHLLDGDLTAAERSLRRAVALAPSSAAAHLWLGELLADRGRRRAAAAAIREAARLAPLSPEAPAALVRLARR